MDYFGVMDAVFPKSEFFCLSVGCKYKQYVYNDITLPYCSENCMHKNFKHLIIENSHLKRERALYSSSPYKFIISDSPNYFGDKISPKRKRDESIRKEKKEHLNKKLSF